MASPGCANGGAAGQKQAQLAIKQDSGQQRRLAQGNSVIWLFIQNLYGKKMIYFFRRPL